MSIRKMKNKSIKSSPLPDADKDYMDFIMGVDDVELTDELIDKLVKDGIDGEFPTRQQLVKLRDNGFTQYNQKRKSFVTPSKFI